MYFSQFTKTSVVKVQVVHTSLVSIKWYSPLYLEKSDKGIFNSTALVWFEWNIGQAAKHLAPTRSPKKPFCIPWQLDLYKNVGSPPVLVLLHFISLPYFAPMEDDFLQYDTVNRLYGIPIKSPIQTRDACGFFTFSSAPFYTQSRGVKLITCRAS